MKLEDWIKNFAYMTVLFSTVALILASGSDVPPGGDGGGYLPLGSSDPTISIDIGPSGADLQLRPSSTATASDSMVISADGAWQLNVEDANAGISNYEGKMRMGSSGWNYDKPDMPLRNNFEILLDGIGNNNNLENVTFTDCTELIGYKTIAASSTGSNSLAVGLMYSQKVADADAQGAYRIDLVYTISRNP